VHFKSKYSSFVALAVVFIRKTKQKTHLQPVLNCNYRLKRKTKC